MRTGERLGASPVCVDDRHQLAVTSRRELLRVVAPHVTRADDGNFQ
jgi:hypothetical protein